MNHKTRRFFVAVSVVLGVMLLVPQPVRSIGGQFGLEFAIDAPWRIEPVPAGNGGYSYSPIPIVASFHDAVYETERGFIGQRKFSTINAGKLHSIRVTEWVADQPHPRQPVTTILPAQLAEIERKALVSTTAEEPRTEVCRPSTGQDCTDLLRVSDSHEWHASFWYTPRAPVTPGRNIHLEVDVITELFGNLRAQWRNYLVVHAGEEPLPRFGAQWLYGDFHYHSQMTDNEGESAYTYRNVARALGALGFDFVFATDHASNGVQVDGKIAASHCAGSRGSDCLEARDLNPRRFARAKEYIYGPGGVNETVAYEAALFARVRSADVLPQVYMGEEVDAWPEMSAAEQQSGRISYGDGLQYAWPDSNDCIRREDLERCRARYSQPAGARDHRTYLVLDEQGVPTEETVEDELGDGILSDIVKAVVPDGTRPFPSRQHLVYFPSNARPTGEGWIGSNTGPFGGAGKRLQQVIAEVASQGIAFLAHPLISSRPGGPGPDVVPYSDVELRLAWSSPAILGLQFWNENDRRMSAPTKLTPTVMFTGRSSVEPNVLRFSFNWPFQGHTYGNYPWTWQRSTSPHVATELYHGAVTWDRMLRKGLDTAETAVLPWLAKGEPRKWFMASGSDSHGDFNFRRYGRPCMDRWCDVPVGDTAIGNPRNLVSMAPLPQREPVVAGDRERTSGPRRYANTQVIERLRAGQFSVTDGPAIRIAIDKNRNGAIDDGDFQMGSTFHFYPGEHIPLLVEWFSTAEFGPVAQVDVYVGAPARTFAPKDHGPIIPPDRNRNADYGAYQPDPSGVLQVRMADAYGRFSLQGVPPESAYRGIARIFLGPAQFGLAGADQALSYVRAFVKTVPPWQAGGCAPGDTAGSMCGNRFGYSNPIWAKYRLECPARVPRGPLGAVVGPLGPVSSFLDGDANGVPDTCERDLPDPCADTGGRAGRRGIIDATRAPLGRREVAPEGGRPTATPGPAKRIPANSCQRVAVVPR